MKKVKTPELEKLVEIRPDNEVISGFLEWLGEKEITLSDWTGLCEDCGNAILAPISITKEQLLANYFSIDLAKCEKERRVLLDDLKADGR